MDGQLFSELISRWVSGDRLAPAEEQDLLEWLENHPQARTELLEDEALDSLLRSWPRLEGTCEDFVRECLRRATGGGTNRREPISTVEAPPVVAPPVVTVRKATGGAWGSRRLFAGSTIRRVVAAAGCSAVVLLGMFGWRWLGRGPQPVETNHFPMPLAGSQNSRPEPDGAFATLAQSAERRVGNAPIRG